MKRIVFLLCLLLSSPLLAQDIPGMNSQDMQKMMQHMQKMQSCMAKIDQSKLAELESKSNQLQSDVFGLCQQGKRQQAQQKAESFAKQLQDDATVKAVQKCTEGMTDMMQSMPLGPMEFDSNMHVCDEPR